MKIIKKYFSFSIAVLIFTLISSNTAIAQDDDRIYIKIHVDGLSCPFCAYGLEKKLKKVKGSKDVFIELNEGIATFNVPEDKIPTKDELENVVKDAGFVPREIIFSDRPFDIKKNE